MLALAFLAAAGAAAQVDVEALSWLSGRWRTETEQKAGGPVWTEEYWTSQIGGTMLGISRTRSGNSIAAFEYMRIARSADGSASFYGSPNGAPAVAFRLVRTDAGEAVFENPAHDFPQRIVYRLAGDELVATVSLIDGSRAASWRFRRQRGAGD